MGSLPLQGPTSFYNYVTPTTAKAIVEHCSFRWSNPSIFNQVNDPFDVPSQISEEINSLELKRARVECMTRLLADPLPSDISKFNDRVKLMIEMRRRIPQAKLPAFLKEIETLDHGPLSTEPLEETNALWKKLRPELRILCLTVDPALDAMWLHYAENHSGIVIEISCMPIFDSPWIAAREVTYTDEPRKLMSADGWADAALYEPSVQVQMMFDDYTLKKKTSWASEREYRVVTFSKANEPCGYTDYHFHPFHFARIILGAKMDPCDKKWLLSTVRQRYPWVKLTQARFGNSGICFDDI